MAVQLKGSARCLSRPVLVGVGFDAPTRTPMPHRQVSELRPRHTLDKESSQKKYNQTCGAVRILVFYVASFLSRFLSCTGYRLLPSFEYSEDTSTNKQYSSHQCAPRENKPFASSRPAPCLSAVSCQAGFQRRPSADLRDDAHDGRELLVLADLNRDGVFRAASVLLRSGLVRSLLGDTGCGRTGDIFGTKAQVIQIETSDPGCGIVASYSIIL